MYLKLLQKKGIQKTAEATDDLVGNNITDNIARTDLQFASNKSAAPAQINEKLIRDVKWGIYIIRKATKIHRWTSIIINIIT